MASSTLIARFESRVPESRELTREEALAELSLRYFRSRRPATIRDFSAWSGLTVADAKTGLELVVTRPEPWRARPSGIVPMYEVFSTGSCEWCWPAGRRAKGC